MNSIYRDIFRAIHEGKWLKIEYRNKDGQITRYWIGILDLNMGKRTLKVDGLHLTQFTTETFDHIYIDSILSSQVVEGSYCPVNQKLVEDIYLNPHKYKTLFDHAANMKILNYLEMCNRMDTTPYYSDFELVHFLDRESFTDEGYELDLEQFQTIVKNFQVKMEERPRRDGKLAVQQLAMNVLSIHSEKGLYVLAYRKLNLDVKCRILRPEPDITICTEYYIGENKESIRRYLDAEEYELLKDFEHNQEKIKDCITRHGKQIMGVDDMPYVIGLGLDVVLDLHKEYQAIIEMYHDNKVTVPVKAFFGDLVSRPRRSKEYPITLINQNINLDQLLAINNGMKYPIAYIQGPPGTGKTNTIINTIITAFFNERTVLFTSYNNHPIDGVFEKLTGLKYKEKKIPFPVLRLGNVDKMKKAIEYIEEIYEQVENITVYETTLDRRKDNRIEEVKQLSNLLKKYEEVLDLKERRETLNRMLEYQRRTRTAMSMLPFQADLEGRQLKWVDDKIREAGQITDKEALALLDDDYEQFLMYLYYTSARYIKKLGNSQYKDLYEIIFECPKEEQAARFSRYLSEEENLKKLQKIFPVIITTCISAHKLGKPTPMFDMVIMDEASQCNTAVALVPIIRGNNLMLVGDPQQLNPVILLDELANQKLRFRYKVTEEYDYRKNSVYKTFLACDAVSDEVLLRNHYRCHEKIIGFNNKKYYDSRLNICSNSDEQQPLVYQDIRNDYPPVKNTAPEEVDAVIKYAKLYRDKKIGVITPFVNQKKLIEDRLHSEKLTNVVCGTVHAFQGDEKDVVLFSTAITDNTHPGTYSWLKNNKELINVATSRARDRLIVLADSRNLTRLHQKGDEDDLFELVDYVRRNGQTQVTPKKTHSRALGVEPFSKYVEEAFLGNLNHALGNIWLSDTRFTVKKEIPISHIFEENFGQDDLFYSGYFDFVVYEKKEGRSIPVLAIELDGKEHYEDEVVKNRDRRKKKICREHNFELLRVENSYARRYNYIKDILMSYFSIRH